MTCLQTQTSPSLSVEIQDNKKYLPASPLERANRNNNKESQDETERIT